MPPTALIPEKAHPIPIYLLLVGPQNWSGRLLKKTHKQTNKKREEEEEEEITFLSPAKNQPTILRIFRLTYLLTYSMEQSFLRS
jgi:hypothetical protein